VSAPLLELDALTVAYGGHTALDRVSLTVGSAEVVALLGANGAGKSSLLRAVLGLLRGRSGRVLFDGVDLAGLSVRRRSRLGIGYAPEGRRVFAGLTVRENLEVAVEGGARERGRRIAMIWELFPQLAERVGVAGWQLSGGQQQMLAIGRAMARAPRLLLLDEPSLGLSPMLVRDVLARLRRIAEGGTAILVAEQNARAALKVADRAYLLRLGRVVGQGTAEDVRNSEALGRTLLGA